MEECLVKAQDRKINLTSDDVDLLLRGVDVLSGIAEAAGGQLPDWLAAHVSPCK